MKFFKTTTCIVVNAEYEKISGSWNLEMKDEMEDHHTLFAWSRFADMDQKLIVDDHVIVEDYITNHGTLYRKITLVKRPDDVLKEWIQRCVNW